MTSYAQLCEDTEFNLIDNSWEFVDICHYNKLNVIYIIKLKMANCEKTAQQI